MPESIERAARALKRAVRSWTDASYARSRRLYLLSLWVRSLGYRGRRRPVVVYQIGKVGSTTVTRALQRVGVPTYHVHLLRADLLEAYARPRRDRQRSVHRDSSRWIWEGEFLGACRLPTAADRWDVVTLVRDPVARDISDFFQNLDDTVPAEVLAAARAPDGDLSGLYECWRQRWVEGAVMDAPTWFEEEFRHVLGVDLLHLPFPLDQGWAVYDEPTARILVIRMEDLAEQGAPALAAFRGVDTTMSSANTRDESGDAVLYRRFLAGLDLPAAYLERSYGSAYARHFYDAARLAAFRARWRQG